MPTVSGIVYNSSGAAVAGRVVRAYSRVSGALLGSTVSNDGVASPGDTHYANVSVAIDFETRDSVVYFADRGPGRRLISFPAGMIPSTNFPRSGVASGVFNGTHVLTLANDAAFDLSSGNFTIEAFVRTGAVLSDSALIGKRVGNGFGPFALIHNANGSVGFFMSNTGATWSFNISSTTGLIVPDTYYHYAATRNGNTITLWVDGVSVATGTFTGAVVVNTALTCIGALSTAATGLVGHMDDVRITKGVARYTAPFTVPASLDFNPSFGVLPLGGYSIDVGTEELYVVGLDDVAGSLENDVIVRTTGV